MTFLHRISEKKIITSNFRVYKDLLGKMSISKILHSFQGLVLQFKIEVKKKRGLETNF